MRPKVRSLAALPALPENTARLFPHYDAAGLDVGPDGRTAPFLIGRLLEDGDGTDLRWLAGKVAEAHLADWLARCGGRQLSTRSLAFWRVVLGPPGERTDERSAEPGAVSGAGLSSKTGAVGAVVREAADLWPL